MLRDDIRSLLAGDFDLPLLGITDEDVDAFVDATSSFRHEFLRAITHKFRRSNTRAPEHAATAMSHRC